MGADDWWLILSYISDHKTQVRCSAVCKEWNRLCNTLPSLHIQVPPGLGKMQTTKFVKSALHHRSSLQELKLFFDHSVCVSEFQIFNTLRLVSSFIQDLHLLSWETAYTKKLWSHLSQDFPNLHKLQLQHGSIRSPPPSRLVLSNLKELLIISKPYISTIVAQGILESCNSLEKLTINRLVFSTDFLALESNTLVSLELAEAYPPSSKTNHLLVLKARNLRNLHARIYGKMEVCGTKELQKLVLCSCESVYLEHLQPKLEFLSISTYLDVYFSYGLQLVTTAKNLQQLIVSLHPNRRVDVIFQKDNIWSILQLLDPHCIDDLPALGLKHVVIDMHDYDTEDIGPKLLVILAKILTYSSKLKYLVIRPPSITGFVCLDD